MVVIALIAMVVGFLAQHLGLTEAVSSVITKVARCYKCTCFWVVLMTMLYFGYDIHYVIALSLICAYLSNWLGLGFAVLNKIYNKIWQRINN